MSNSHRLGGPVASIAFQIVTERPKTSPAIRIRGRYWRVSNTRASFLPIPAKISIDALSTGVGNGRSDGGQGFTGQTVPAAMLAPAACHPRQLARSGPSVGPAGEVAVSGSGVARTRPDATV